MKYDPLAQFLKGQSKEHLAMTFAEVERALHSKLPRSAFDHQAWWANDFGKSHVQSRAWLQAGYQTEQVDIASKRLVFRRIAKSSGGMSDEPREFKSSADAGEKKMGRHPALGSMKGTFTIEPGYDLTSPMFTDEEWAEIEKEMDEDWDQIEQGMTGKNK